MCKATTANRSSVPQEVNSNEPSAPLQITISKVVRQAPVADGSKIRSRFLDRLGISPPLQRQCHQTNNLDRRTLQFCNRTSSAAAVETKEERLKKDHGQQDESIGLGSSSKLSFSPKTHQGMMRKRNDSTASLASTTSTNTAKAVSFANAVQVISIPSHRDYSDRIKNAFWTNAQEMRQNYARNVVEFTAENWDYRQVLEEDQFLYIQVTTGGKCSAGTNEMVLMHPVHFRSQQLQRERQLRWHSFCAVMSAQRQHHQQLQAVYR
jgi:hypothetical protein